MPILININIAPANIDTIKKIFIIFIVNDYKTLIDIYLCKFTFT